MPEVLELAVLPSEEVKLSVLSHSAEVSRLIQRLAPAAVHRAADKILCCLFRCVVVAERKSGSADANLTCPAILNGFALVIKEQYLIIPVCSADRDHLIRLDHVVYNIICA